MEQFLEGIRLVCVVDDDRWSTVDTHAFEASAHGVEVADARFNCLHRNPDSEGRADRAEPVVQIGLTEEIRFDANRTGRCDDIAAQTSNRDLESFSRPNVRFFPECDDGIAA